MGRTKIARRAKPVDFISYTPQLFERFSFSSQEFYNRLERALAERDIPDLDMRRVIWKEGGMLSPGREYLRVQRERYVFDVCAAPFGTGFFVSLWCAERPLRMGILLWFLLLSALLVSTVCFMQNEMQIHFYLMQNFGLNWTGAAAVAFFGLLCVYLFAAVIVGSHLDMFMMGVPVLGYFYERYFRTITYYRVDMMSMYRAAVKAAVHQVIDEITKAKGISPASEFGEKPIMRQLLEPQPFHA
jgi:hypothetical protein